MACALALHFQRFEATATVSKSRLGARMSFRSVSDFMLQLFRSKANKDGTIKDNVQVYPGLVRSYLSSGEQTSAISTEKLCVLY